MPSHQLGDIERISQKPKRTSFDNSNMLTAQRNLEPAPGGPARAQRVQAYKVAATGADLLAGALPSPAGNGWTRAGNGVAMSITDGIPGFTNEPAAVAGAQAMPSGGMGNMANGRGTFSQLEPGAARLAQETYERANQERARMIEESRRGQLGEGSGRLTVVRDSSRAPSRADIQNARLDAMQAQTNLQNQKGTQAMLAGLDLRKISELQRQRLQQEIQSGNLAIEREQTLGGILAGLPGLQGEERAQAGRNYLMIADPRAYMEQQSRAGLDQLDLEKRQLQRDLLAQELAQGAEGSIKLTEQQSKDLGYYTRGNEANALLAQQGDALTARATGERGETRGAIDALVRGLPLIGDSALGNSLVSTERQQAEQSGREVLAAILRKDTGAAITQQEMDIYGRMYLPQPGDSDAVLNQKAQGRTRSLGAILSGLGTAERKAAPLKDGRRQADPAARAGQPVRVTSPEEVAALPSGTVFMGPDGVARRKP